MPTITSVPPSTRLHMRALAITFGPAISTATSASPSWGTAGPSKLKITPFARATIVSGSIVIFGDTTVLEQPVSINPLHCYPFTVIVRITTPFSDFFRSTGTGPTVAPTTARTCFPTSGLQLPSPPVASDGTTNGLPGLHRHDQRPCRDSGHIVDHHVGHAFPCSNADHSADLLHS